VVRVRGKPRSGFDFDVTIAWEAVFLTGDVDGLTGDGEKVTVKGTLHVPEASGDTVADDEVEYAVTVEDRKADRRAQEDLVFQSLRSGLRKFLHETFSTIDVELKKRAKT